MLILDAINLQGKKSLTFTLQCDTKDGMLVKDFVQLTERAAGYLGKDFTRFDKQLETEA